MIEKFNFATAIDLQNSSRTNFYRKYLFKIPKWNSTATVLKSEIKKKDFDKDPVLERFKFQLEGSNIITKHTLKPNFSWASVNVDKTVNKFFGKKFILVFPFSSPQLSHKQWPHYNELIKLIKLKNPELEIAVAPGPNELESAKKINAVTILNNNKALNISELAGLIKKSSFVIANDTGPAHMAAHLGAQGVVLFGYHTSPSKVSIETEKFRALEVDDLFKLTPEKVYTEIEASLKTLIVN